MEFARTHRRTGFIPGREGDTAGIRREKEEDAIRASTREGGRYDQGFRGRRRGIRSGFRPDREGNKAGIRRKNEGDMSRVSTGEGGGGVLMVGVRRVSTGDGRG